MKKNNSICSLEKSCVNKSNSSEIQGYALANVTQNELKQGLSQATPPGVQDSSKLN